MKFLFWFLLIFISSFANNFKPELTLEWLSKQPRSITKDFYIWQFLNTNITPQEAINALGQARYVNNKLLFRYAKKLKHKETSTVIWCMKQKASKLASQSAMCIENGMTTYKATKLIGDKLAIVISKVKSKYPASSQRFKILNSSQPFVSLINSKAEIFFDTFNECGGKYRENNFNHHLTKEVIAIKQKIALS